MERFYERYMFLSLKKYVKVHKFDGEVVKNTASSYPISCPNDVSQNRFSIIKPQDVL